MDMSYKELVDMAKENGWKVPSYEAWCLAVATDAMRECNEVVNDSLSYIRTFLDNEIQTFESKVQEEANFQLNSTVTNQQSIIVPQTSSLEIIESIAWSLYPSNGVWAGFAPGSLILALTMGGKNLVLFDGSANVLSGFIAPLQLKVGSTDKRIVTAAVGTGDLPVNTSVFVTIAGYAVPMTQGRGLH